VRALVTSVAREQPHVLGWSVLGASAALWTLAPWLGVSEYWVIQLLLIGVLALIVSGLNLSYGYAGELSLGQVAMYAVGAYLSGYMALHGLNDFALTLLCAAVAACLVGLLSGIPGLRLGGWSLAMVSFFLVLLVPDVVSLLPGETGGYTGMYGIPDPKLFGYQLSPHAFYVASIVVVLLWLLVMRNLVTSRHGDALRVLRESPVLARSMGMSVFRTKLFAYALGAVPAGMAGTIFAYQERFVGPDTFSFSFSVAIIAASILGGAESVYGAAVGGALLEVGPLQANLFENYSLLVYGAFLVVGGVLLRGGLARLGRMASSRLIFAMTREGMTVEAVSGRGSPIQQELDLGPLPGERLSVSGAVMTFGGVTALDSVDLTAEPGKITAIIGSNGSGKTTLLNVVSGLLHPVSGEVWLGDRRIDRLQAHQIARSGVSRTFQTPLIPRSMSCAAAVSVARYVRPRLGILPAILRSSGSRRIHHSDRREAARFLDALGLGDLMDVEATQLPLGRRRLVELARALITQPSLLLLDEPASGLERSEVSVLGTVLRAVASAGVTVVLVEHNFRFVMDIADSVCVLDRGDVIAVGSPAEVESNPAVIASYLGGEIELQPIGPHPRSPAADSRTRPVT
jgi:branched-chain amino acid transport system permease protein